MTSRKALKSKIAVVLFIAIYLIVWGFVSRGAAIPMMLIPTCLILIALFAIPTKWAWCGCTIMLLLHVVFLPIGIIDYPTRYVCGCPIGPDWESIAFLIGALIFCLFALVLFLIIGKPLFQPVPPAINETPTKTATGLKYWQAILISILVAAIIAIPLLLILCTPGEYSMARPYTPQKQEIQDAVTAYRQNNSGTLPVIPGANVSINGSNYSIINLCNLLKSANQPGLLYAIPRGVYSAPGPNNDNCDGTGTCCGCCAASHYIWAVDANGSVLSTCVNSKGNGGGCANVSQDGFQNVWP